MDVENKLKAMGLELPAAGAPPPGRAGAVKIGNILFVGGHTPGPAYRGKLGAGFTVEQGYDGARQACLNCLADVKAVLGDLDKVKRVAKLLCIVNSAPDFGQQPLVANGATRGCCASSTARTRWRRSIGACTSIPSGRRTWPSSPSW